MPTSYTSDLHSGKKMTLAAYLMRCARASGKLDRIREYPIDAVIPDRFETYSYYIEQLEKAEANVARIKQWDDTEANRQAKLFYDSKTDLYQGWLNEAAEIRKRYETMLAKVKAWTPPTPEHQEIKEIAIQQLEQSIDSDCQTDHLTAPELSTGAVFKEEALRAARQEVSRYTEWYEEDKKRVKELTEWVKALRQSLAAPSDAPPEA